MAAATAAPSVDNFTGTGGTGNTTAGADSISAATGTANAGDVWNGGAGVDTLDLSSSGTTMDLSVVSISNVENLTSGSGGETVTMTASQLFGFTSIDLGGAADTLSVNVTGTGDFSALTFPALSNVESVRLVGSAGSDTVTFTGAQLDQFTTISLAVGADTINLTGTSTGLNGLSDANLSGVENISASAATAGVTLTLSSQIEGFAVTGSSNTDTITGGAGVDTIVGGAGDDTITGGAGVDNLTGGTGADTFVVGAVAHLAAGETINGTAEAATLDTLRLDVAGTYNLSTFSTISNIDKITLNQNATGFSLTVADSQVASADANGDGTGGDMLISSTVAMTNAATVSGAGVTGTNRITVDGTNLGGADIITGGAGADTISGGAGNDTITGGAGADNLAGGTGADTFVIGAVAHLAAGETINGTAEAATLDTLRLDVAGVYNLSAFATISNIDKITLNQNAAGFNLTVADSQVSTADADGNGTGGDMLISSAIAMTNAATVSGAALTGTNRITVDGTNLGGADTITGGAGNDVLGGGAGVDAIVGGAGDDTITGGAGVDNLTGGTGADTFVIGAVAHLAAGETINGTAEAATLDTLRLDVAGTYNLSTFSTISNIDKITLNQNAVGFNLTVADSQVSTADADGNGTGGDMLISSTVAMTNAATISGAGVTGTNRITVDGTNLGGADIITGGAGADTISGGAGNDTITGGAGVDNLTGGTGADTFVVGAVAHLAAGETINGTAEAATLDTLRLDVAGTYNLSTFSTISNIDKITLNQNATGFSLTVADSQAASADANGDGTGGDMLISSTVAMTNAATVSGAGVTGTNRITVDGTNLGGADIITGGAGADTISGGAGNDTITGGAGADNLAGGTGADTFVIGAVAHLAAGETINGTAEAATLDTLRLDVAGTYNLSTFSTISNIDKITLNQNAAGFNLTVADSQVSTADADGNGTGGDMLISSAIAMTNAATISGAGLTGTNRITVDGTNLGGADTITGGAGNDVLGGGAGADNLAGGTGADTFVIGAVAHLAAGETINGTAEAATLDTLRLDVAGTYNLSTFSTISNIDKITLNQNAVGFNLTVADSQVSTADADGNGTGGDMLISSTVAMTNAATVSGAGVTGTNRITVDGTNLGGADIITGGAGADTISGGAGNDTITGGAGADNLAGGTGADTFVIGAVAHLAAGETINGTAEAATLDTLRLDVAGTYNLSTFSTISNIDKITLNQNAASFSLTVGDSQVASADANGDSTGGDMLISSAVAMSGGNGVTISGAGLTGANRITVDGTNLGGADTISGGAGNDVLGGGAGVDTIVGGAGDDTITGGAGADNLTGGTGADTFVIGVVADLAAGETIDGTAEAATLDTLRLDVTGVYNLSAFATISNIDKITLNQNAAGFNLTVADSQVSTADADSNGTGGDMLISSATAMTNAATISAAGLTGINRITVDGTNLGGADIITGGASADTISGGAGADTITGGAGADNLTGGTGADTFVIGAVAHLAAGETIDGSAEAATLDTLRLDVAGTYNLTTFATISNIDKITLNQNAAGFSLTVADSQVASADANGDGTGGDMLISSAVAMTNGVTVSGAGLTGTNRIAVDGTNLGGADTITGGAGADTISGGAGNDTITGGGGDDAVDGGAGAGDRVVFSGAWADYTIANNAGIYTISDNRSGSPAGTDTVTNVESFTFSNGTFTAAQILNDAPVGVNDTNALDPVIEAGGVGNSTPGDATATGNVLTNDTDPDSALGDTRTVSGIRTGTEVAGGALTALSGATVVTGIFGSLLINTDGSYTYTLDNNDADTQLLAGGAIAVEEFTYRIADAKGATDLAQLSITVTGANDAPVVLAGSSLDYGENDAATTIAPTIAITDVDTASLTSATVSITGNFANDQDVLGFINQNGITGNYNTGSGVLTLTGTATLAQYQAALASVAYFNSSDNPTVSSRTISFVANDGTTDSAPATSTVNITTVNDAPLANPVDLGAIAEDSGGHLITAAQLLAGVTDVDGPAAFIIALTLTSANGTLLDNGNGTWTYTPAANDDSAASFSYTASDGTLSAASTALLDITPVNDAPVASPVDLGAVAEDSGGHLITAAQLLAGVTDVDGPAASITELTLTSANGTLLDNGNGTWTYTPAANDDSAASFSYTASDGTLGASSTASLDLTPVNDAPLANPVDLGAIAEDSGGHLITAAQLLAGVTDVDGPAASITELTLSSGNGTLLDNGNGTWTYSPAANDDSAASFSYTASDGTLSAASTASLDITPVNDAPVASPLDLGAIAEDTGGHLITAAQLLAGVTDIDGAAAFITTLTLTSANGTLLDNGNGTWTYTPAANDDTAASFNYTASDGSLSAASTATLDITPVNDAPSGTTSTIIALQNTAYILAATDFGFHDIDGNALAAVKIGSTPLAGTLTNNGVAVVAGQFVSIADINAGHLAFQAALNASGAAYAQFSFQVQDDGSTANGGVDLDQSARTLTINVSGANQPATVSLNNVRGPIAENASTIVAMKVADIVIADVDGGVNNLSLIGFDANLFQIVGQTLWLKAGAHLDFETNPLLNVTVNVDDPTIGGAVDDSASLAIAVGNVVEPIAGRPGADILNGSNVGDIIYGLAGNDVIRGYGGNDRLVGGLGVDVMSGGAGNDVFVFNSIRESGYHQSGLINNGSLSPLSGQGQRDIITDFTQGQDKIDLSAIDANTRAAGNQAFAWRGTGNLTHVPGQLIERIYDFTGTGNDKTIIYGDLNGDAISDFQIQLSGLKHLFASDFVL